MAAESAGIRFYLANGCGDCHGSSAEGGNQGPTLIGASCELIFDNLTGNDPHPITVNVDQVFTPTALPDMEAWLNSL
jgi:mono/diheme cytochrome c family protein